MRGRIKEGSAFRGSTVPCKKGRFLPLDRVSTANAFPYRGGRPLCASENTNCERVLFPRGGKGTGSDRVLFRCCGTLFACSVDTGGSPI